MGNHEGEASLCEYHGEIGPVGEFLDLVEYSDRWTVTDYDTVDNDSWSDSYGEVSSFTRISRLGAGHRVWVTIPR